MNDLDLYLEVFKGHVNHTILRHIRHWISRKPLEIESWFQRTTHQ